MADQQTNWATYDGKSFGDEQIAEDHETAVDAVVTQWVKENLGDYVGEDDYLAAGKVLLDNVSDFVKVVRRA